MSGMTRRAFLATTSALAAAWAIPKDSFAATVAAPAKPADVPTTLQETIRFTAPVYRNYRHLAAAPGQPYITRLDVLGKEANPARTNTRRSLLYIGHLTDIHMIDAQAPMRLEPMSGQSASLWAGVFHPQDTLQMNILTAMTQAINAAKYSPVTGAPMQAAVNTGDSADSKSSLELDWYINVLDGSTQTPNSGLVGTYQGVQVFENTWAYHPEDPSNDNFGAYGYPQLKGMLQAAVTQKIVSPGLAVPWYAVFGNHDTLINGVIPADSGLRALALGDRKPNNWETLANVYLRGMATDSSVFTRLTDQVWSQLGLDSGMTKVTPNGERKLLEKLDFVQAHLDSPAIPGPVGHGFTQDNLTTGQTYWQADLSQNFRVFGLDTCNQTAGPDGAVPESQFNWLKAGLQQCQQENKMAIVISHHNSQTLENAAEPIWGGETLYHAPEFVDMLSSFPNLVAWVNGHTHINEITAHAKKDGGGFWEITAASCVDFPQQQQMLEFVDNRDGTLSIFATTLDHASPAAWSEGDYSQTGLASLSRQLSANDWIENPPMRLGAPTDRNVELLLPAPFDLSTITDASLEAERAAATARLTAFEQRQPK